MLFFTVAYIYHLNINHVKINAASLPGGCSTYSGAVEEVLIRNWHPLE